MDVYQGKLWINHLSTYSFIETEIATTTATFSSNYEFVMKKNNSINWVIQLKS